MRDFLKCRTIGARLSTCASILSLPRRIMSSRCCSGVGNPKVPVLRTAVFLARRLFEKWLRICSTHACFFKRPIAHATRLARSCRGFHVVRSTRPCILVITNFVQDRQYCRPRDDSHKAKWPDYPSPELYLSRTSQYFFRTVCMRVHVRSAGHSARDCARCI